MIEIETHNLSKGYGGHEVLQDVTFSVTRGEHVGLLGRNGAGKTTLFRLLCGQEQPDGGGFRIASDATLGVLNQIPVVPAHFTALDTLREAFRPFREMEAALRDMERRLDTEPALLRPYGELSHRYEHQGGFETDLRESIVRQGLGLSDRLLARPFSSLSGGEKTRVHLARLMLEHPTVLLLDEPTNHLDMRGTEWLEEFLESYPNTVLIISHDRFFLDNTVRRIIELNDGQCVFYRGSYSFYAEEKERLYQEQLQKHQREQQEIARLEGVARRMHDYAGKSAKLHRRAFAIEKRASRVAVTDKPRWHKELRARFTSVPFQADDVLRLEELSKAFGDKTLFSSLTLSIRPGDRIALLGDNGTGKTTLLSILNGTHTPDSGRVHLGPAVKMGLLPQVITFEHPERTLLDTLLYETGCTATAARNRLGSFHFQGDRVFDRVETLSGGEKTRLKLCILMEMEITFLMLDEPTNHLDIQSREWIEEALDSFDGTLLFISHDRYFISRFATRVWALEKGKASDFHGSYEEYRTLLELQKEMPEDTPPPPPKKTAVQPKNKASERQQRVLEREMAALERRERELEAEMEQHTSDSVRLAELMEEIAAVKAEWHDTYTQWEGYE